MKSIAIIALALVAVAAALPGEKQEVQIVRSNFEQNPDGSYVFEYETSDGSKRIERGELKQVLDEKNVPQNVVVVKGQYYYVKEDGQLESITYEADENGYRADGPSIPKAPVTGQ